VQPAGVVPLDDEDRLLAALGRTERLGRDLRIAFAVVLGERHGRSLALCGAVEVAEPGFSTGRVQRTEV